MVVSAESGMGIYKYDKERLRIYINIPANQILRTSSFVHGDLFPGTKLTCGTLPSAICPSINRQQCVLRRLSQSASSVTIVDLTVGHWARVVHIARVPLQGFH
jgi:hypothetical protein